MPAKNDNQQGPCAGIKVLELATSMVSGPYCGQILGDLGADVIKLEGPRGDLMRMVPPMRAGMSAQFIQFNRNKRSIMADFKSPEGYEIAIALIRQADVLIENFRPGVAEKMGFGYDHVKTLNDGLIYASINGFGAEGPYAKLPAYDQVMQGIVGFMPIQGSAEHPVAIKSVVVDKVTGLSAGAAILGALLNRARGGSGQRVEIKMLDAYAAFILPEFLAAYTFMDEPAARLPNSSIYQPLRTSDGHLVGLIAQDSQFKAICEALNCTELFGDDRFATSAKRFANMQFLLAALEEKTMMMTTAAVLDILWGNAEVAIGPVNSIETFLEDPQVRFNQTIYSRRDPKLGAIRQLAPFASYEKTVAGAGIRAPYTGEHTNEIMQELNYSDNSINDLHARTVIAQYSETSGED